MARPKDEDLGDDFSYILRMADTDMDGLKPLATALTSPTHSPASSTPTSKNNSALPSNPTPRAFLSGCSTDSETSKPATKFT